MCLGQLLEVVLIAERVLAGLVALGGLAFFFRGVYTACNPATCLCWRPTFFVSPADNLW